MLAEIGSLYIASSSAAAMRNPRPYVIKQDHIFVAQHNVQHGHFSLHVTDHSGTKAVGFGTFKDHPAYSAFWVTISAENVVSRDVRLSFNPYEGDWPDWLIIKEKKDE